MRCWASARIFASFIETCLADHGRDLNAGEGMEACGLHGAATGSIGTPATRLMFGDVHTAPLAPGIGPPPSGAGSRALPTAVMVIRIAARPAALDRALTHYVRVTVASVAVFVVLIAFTPFVLVPPPMVFAIVITFTIAFVISAIAFHDAARCKCNQCHE
jgi:hypothetical protein